MGINSTRGRKRREGEKGKTRDARKTNFKEMEAKLVKT